MPHREWRFEEVPQSFWTRIEQAQGDPERFRASLAGLSREELQEMFDQYLELTEQLFDIAQFDHNEDTALDIATWVVMQGRDFYKNILEHPETAPRERQLHGPSFATMIMDTYYERCGESIG